MNLPHIATVTAALPGQPKQPIKYVWPVTAPDGSVGYDRPLDNYFDVTMAPRLLPSKPPTRLYDTVARAYDHRFQVTPDMVDPSWPISRPLILHPRERRRSLACLPGNSTEYMGISPDLPGWRPRRSSYEDRRGAVGVAPNQVNTLVTRIPPIDASSPPPSREWLDAMAKQFLANAQADINSLHHATRDNTQPGLPSLHTNDGDVDYDTDSTLDGAPVAPCMSMPQPLQHAYQPESTSHDADFNSSSDTDTDIDTEADTNSDDGYSWNTTRVSESSPRALGDASRWIISRKRPSVVMVNKNDVTVVADDSDDITRSTSLSSGRDDSVSSSASSDEDEHVGKRRRGGKSPCLNRVAKKPKMHANDTPVRGRQRVRVQHTSEAEEDCLSDRAAIVPLAARTPSPGNGTATALCPSTSAVTATALQMKQVRITSPCTAPSPGTLLQSNITPVLVPKFSKVFPCLLDGCMQVCASAGDLQRHQQSLRHCAPSYTCLACGKSYTRSDALKRHLNSKVSCKKMHTAKCITSAADVEEVGTEASEGAVY